MKLLFDENLSPKLPALLESKFPGSRHWRDFRLTVVCGTVVRQLIA